MGLLARLLGKGRQATGSGPRPSHGRIGPVLQVVHAPIPVDPRALHPSERDKGFCISIRSLAYAPDGGALVVCGTWVEPETASTTIHVSGSVAILDARSLQVVQYLDNGAFPGPVRYWRDGKSVVGKVDGELRRRDVESGTVIATFDTKIDVASLSEDGAAAVVWKLDRSVWAIDLLTGTRCGPYEPAQGRLLSVDAQHQFVVGTERGQVTLSNLLTGSREALGAWKGHEVSAASLSPNGSVLAVGSNEGVVALWKVDGNAKLFEFGLDKGRINHCLFTPDGSFLLFFSTTGGLYSANVATYDIEATLNAHPEPILAAACSPDGGTLVTTGMSGTLMVWSLPRVGQAAATPPASA